MTAAPSIQSSITAEEYFDFDEKSPNKNEFVNGRILNMAGAMPNHNSVIANLTAELRTCFRGKSCKVYPTEMRVGVGLGGQYVYPDIVAVCGKPLFDRQRKPYTLLNPTLIIEVLSDSTQDYDLNEKAQLYRDKETIQEILFVEPNEVFVLHLSRHNGTTWIENTYTSLFDTVRLTSLGCELALEEIYLDVEFGEEDED